MTPLESALVSSALIGTGIASFVWGYRRRRAWERGEVPVRASPSFRISPTAPGSWRMSLGIALIFVGAMISAPFVASL